MTTIKPLSPVEIYVVIIAMAIWVAAGISTHIWYTHLPLHTDFFDKMERLILVLFSWFAAAGYTHVCVVPKIPSLKVTLGMK